VGIILVTDPFGRPASPHLGSNLHVRGTDDHLPTNLASKLIGLSLCLPDVATTAAESGSKSSSCGESLNPSGDHAKDQRPSVHGADPHYPFTLPSSHSGSASQSPFRSTRADNDNRFLAASGTNLVAPNHTLGWILLLGVVVSIS